VRGVVWWCVGDWLPRREGLTWRGACFYARVGIGMVSCMQGTVRGPKYAAASGGTPLDALRGDGDARRNRLGVVFRAVGYVYGLVSGFLSGKGVLPHLLLLLLVLVARFLAAFV